MRAVQEEPRSTRRRGASERGRPTGVVVPADPMQAPSRLEIARGLLTLSLRLRATNAESNSSYSHVRVSQVKQHNGTQG